jgi:hypothetical protein
MEVEGDAYGLPPAQGSVVPIQDYDLAQFAVTVGACSRVAAPVVLPVALAIAFPVARTIAVRVALRVARSVALPTAGVTVRRRARAH